MKKLSSQYRWILYPTLLAVLFTSFSYKAYLDSKEQTILLEKLQELGVDFEKVQSDWLNKLPLFVQDIFPPHIEVEIETNNFLLEVYIGESSAYSIDEESINNLARLKNVHSISMSSEEDSKIYIDLQSRLINSISKIRNLEKLNITSPKLLNIDLQQLAILEELKVLEINCDEIPKATIENISPLNNLERLIIDTVSNFYESDLKYLSQFTKLKYLGLGEDCTLTCGAGPAFYNYKRIDHFIPSLENLNYLGVTMNIENVSLKGFPSLVALGNNFEYDDDSLKKISSSLVPNKNKIINQELEQGFWYSSITLGYDITDEGISFLNQMIWLTDISILNPDLDLNKIHWENFKNLNTVELPYGVNISQIIAILKRMKSLKSLRGYSEDFTFQHFKNLKRFGVHLDELWLYDRLENSSLHNSLQEVGIAFCGIGSDEEVKVFGLESLKNLPKDSEHIDLNVYELSTDVVSELNKFYKLTELNIDCYDGLENLNLLSIKDQIKELYLSFAVKSPQRITGFYKTKKLALDIKYQRSNIDIVIDYKSLPKLDSLILYSRSDIDLEGIQNCKELTTLKLYGPKLSIIKKNIVAFPRDYIFPRCKNAFCYRIS